MSFASNLKELLELREMQIKELSAKTGISKNTIDNYLSGQKSIPNAQNAIKIAKALNTTAEFLVTGESGLKGQQFFSRSKKDVPAKCKKLFAAIQKLDEADFASVTVLVESMLRHYKGNA